MPIIKTKTPMPTQPPRERIRNFGEVALGYTEEEALQEASRCIFCKNHPCVPACPVGIDIPGFIKLIQQRDYLGAARLMKETNSLPAICGRVCPQEEQCEKTCTLGVKHEPIAIGRLERFVADYEATQGVTAEKVSADRTAVAVVGSGPAGLTAAGDLIKMGHRVTVFESLHAPGGVLRYGIPEFRLPKTIVAREIDYLRQLGVEIMPSIVVGNTITLDELLRDYHAVFVGTGAGLPHFMGVPGETLTDVYSANEFLTRVNLMKAYLFPEYDTPVKIGRRVAVVGAGNTAMDACRTALRLGAEEVYCVYRRSRKEMPAREEEIVRAQEEGVQFHLLTLPVRILGDGDGSVTGMECLKMELGEPDESGRRRPVPIAGSEFTVGVDTVVISIGQGPNPLLPSATPGLKTDKRGSIVADEETGATSIPRVYAGGDIAWTGGTVIAAMGAAKKAAAAIHECIRQSYRKA